MPIVEIVSFTASEALIKDISLGDAAANYLKKADGALSVRRGTQLEDPTKAYLIIAWESYDHYKKLTERADFNDFLTSLKPNLASVPVRQFVEFSDDISAAFNAPLTEIAIINVREGKTSDDIVALAASIKDIDASPGFYPPPVYGPVKDTPGSFLLAVGWESPAAHKTAVSAPPFSGFVGKLFELAELDVKHSALTIV